MSRARLVLIASTVFAAIIGGVPSERSARASGACRVLRYTFQPDCYRDPGAASCTQTITHLDLGPQIAVWVQSADDSRFIDTLMVTNMTAARGLGNRPGIWNFLSGPKFPYGSRVMALPIWAYARGVLYDQVVMQEPDREDWLGWHEAYSSQDPYYCRPVRPDEIRVDAITCPTKFNSEKGRFGGSKSYYPPRNDLTNFVPADGADPRTYADVNDLDAVATATPAYGAPFNSSWLIPSTLTDGEYALMVEVSKEFDVNASHDHAAFEDPRLPGYGFNHNFGQPSVVYRVPFTIDENRMEASGVLQIAGYSDWTGQPGALMAPDQTISTDKLGSGAGRLLPITGPAGSARVHVSFERCRAPADGGTISVGDGGSLGGDGGSGTGGDFCTPMPAPPETVTGLEVVEGSVTATSVVVVFVNAAADGRIPVLKYEIRYRPGMSMDADEFKQATAAPAVQPSKPGTRASLTVTDLKPGVPYVLGVRSVDDCGLRSEIAQVTFTTGTTKFKQLSGCFVATAAYGSALEGQVAALRQARDRLRPTSTLLAAATDLYYRSGPAAADVLRLSDTARAVVRRVLGPVAAITEAALAIADWNATRAGYFRHPRRTGAITRPYDSHGGGR